MSSLRTVSKALPRVSMARIPMVVFASQGPAIVSSHSSSSSSSSSSEHSSGFSSMPPRQKETSWSKSARAAADRLEHSAKKMAQQDKDYLREVKQYDSPEDEVLMNLGLARSSNDGQHQPQQLQGQGAEHTMYSGQSAGRHHGGVKSGFSKSFLEPGVGGGSNKNQEGWTFTGKASGFEQSLVDQVQADVLHPSASKEHLQQSKHAPEMVTSICQELKSSSSSSPKLSIYASDAIRMVESHSILKQDRAPVHDMREEDPTESLSTRMKTK
ncbi:hypothetical protein BGZ94_009058 [Podila epigama]|nr:hypothetical protein BGZ94_009058 [Podila epigama]